METTDSTRRTEENRTARPSGAGGLPPRERLIRPGAAAEILGVDRRTLLRYVEAGLITRVRTLGGHGRYREGEIRALVAARTDEATPASAGSLVCANCGAPLPGDDHTCTTRVARPAAKVAAVAA